MKLAEEYLEEFEQQGEAFFVELQGVTASPKEIMREMVKYEKIIRKYIERMNSLHLPCPKSNKTKNDPELRRYLYWAKNFETKEKRIIDNFTQRTNQILTSAGFKQV